MNVEEVSGIICDDPELLAKIEAALEVSDARTFAAELAAVRRRQRPGKRRRQTQIVFDDQTRALKQVVAKLKNEEKTFLQSATWPPTWEAFQPWYVAFKIEQAQRIAPFFKSFAPRVRLDAVLEAFSHYLRLQRVNKQHVYTIMGHACSEIIVRCREHISRVDWLSGEPVVVFRGEWSYVYAAAAQLMTRHCCRSYAETRALLLRDTRWGLKQAETQS